MLVSFGMCRPVSHSWPIHGRVYTRLALENVAPQVEVEIFVKNIEVLVEYRGNEKLHGSNPQTVLVFYAMIFAMRLEKRSSSKKKRFIYSVYQPSHPSRFLFQIVPNPGRQVGKKVFLFSRDFLLLALALPAHGVTA